MCHFPHSKICQSNQVNIPDAEAEYFLAASAFSKWNLKASRWSVLRCLNNLGASTATVDGAGAWSGRWWREPRCSPMANNVMQSNKGTALHTIQLFRRICFAGKSSIKREWLVCWKKTSSLQTRIVLILNYKSFSNRLSLTIPSICNMCILNTIYYNLIYSPIE